FTHSPRARGWLILECASASYGKTTPYLPIVELIRTYCKIQDGDDRREIREKMTGKLLSLDRSLDSVLPPLLGLFDVEVDDSEWQALDPARRRQRIIAAFRRLMIRESQVQPLALLFEDLQWVDSETQAVLDGLVEGLPAARVLLLVDYR